MCSPGPWCWSPCCSCLKGWWLDAVEGDDPPRSADRHIRKPPEQSAAGAKHPGARNRRLAILEGGEGAVSLFVIADAAALAGNPRDIGLLRNRLGGAGLGEIIVDCRNRAFLDVVEDLLTQGVVLDLQISDIRSHEIGIGMRGKLAVGDVKTKYVEIAVAELLVVLVVEFGERGGFVGLELSHSTIEHGSCLGSGAELLSDSKDAGPRQRSCCQAHRNHSPLHDVLPATRMLGEFRPSRRP